MRQLAKVTQFLAAALVVAAGIPLAANQWSQFCARRADRGRAAEFATVGRAALDKGDAAVAAQAYASAVDADPEDTSLRASLMGARVQQVLDEPRALSLRAALRLQVELQSALAREATPDTRESLAMGRILQYRNEQDAAREQFKAVADRDPKSALAALFYGDALLKASRLEEAATVLARSLDLDPKSGLAHFALGQVRLLQQQPDGAFEHLTEAVKALPLNPQVHLALGRSQAQLKKWPEAQASLERALAIDPNLGGTHGLLGEAYASNGKVDAALGALKIAYEKEGDLVAFRNMGRIYLQVNRHQDAMQVFQALNRLNPDDPEPLLAIATSAATLGDANVATAALKRCIEVSQKSPDFAQWGQAAQERLATLEKQLLAAKATGGAKAPKGK